MPIGPGSIAYARWRVHYVDRRVRGASENVVLMFNEAKLFPGARAACHGGRDDASGLIELMQQVRRKGFNERLLPVRIMRKRSAKLRKVLHAGHWNLR